MTAQRQRASRRRSRRGRLKSTADNSRRLLTIRTRLKRRLEDALFSFTTRRSIHEDSSRSSRRRADGKPSDHRRGNRGEAGETGRQQAPWHPAPAVRARAAAIAASDAGDIAVLTGDGISKKSIQARERRVTFVAPSYRRRQGIHADRCPVRTTNSGPHQGINTGSIRDLRLDKEKMQERLAKLAGGVA